MKILKTKFLLATLLCVFSLTLLFAASTDSNSAESKFWGTECHNETSGGGASCVTTRTICTSYVFWIETGSQVTNVSIDCSHLTPQ